MIRIASYANEPILIEAKTLEGINLSGMNMHRAILNEMGLKDSVLINTDLRCVELEGADFSRSNLVGASLICSWARNSNFCHADLKNTKMIGMKLQYENLQYADLTNADVGGASFDNADLRGSIMLCIRIEGASFTNAIFDDSTRWVEGFEPLDRGAIQK